ncbi:Hypothetical predicted protein, partial [Paramuricea clavata]
MAEAAVKNAKSLMKKCFGNWEEFRSRWSEWRNIPRSNGISPAELLLGRRQRGLLPVIPPPDTTVKENPKVKGKPLRDLKPGEIVWLQNVNTKKWDESGRVTSMRQHGRSYWIETEAGWKTLRNRRFLKPVKNAKMTPKKHETKSKSNVGIEDVPRRSE